MTRETNFEFQFAETWVIPFICDVDLDGAVVTFMLSAADVMVLNISTDDSPSVFSFDSPELSGTVTIDPERQDYSTSPSAGLSVSPGVYNYEIRADYAASSPVGGSSVVQYGKLIIQASLFAWPVVS
jgi:hypothetical protein